MVSDLQELIDDLADQLGRPVALDGRDWQLLAASAYLGNGDRVRLRSLTARTTAPEVVAWIQSHDLRGSTGIVEVPANESLEIGGRIFYTVRLQDVTLGYLSAIADGRPLTEPDREAFEAAAAAAARILWSKQSQHAAEHEREEELLNRLLDSADPEQRAAAARELEARPRWGMSDQYVLALGRLPAPDASAEAGERARRHWVAGDLIWRERGSQLTVLARLPAGNGPNDVSAALLRGGAELATTAILTDLEGAGQVLRDTADALLVLERLPELGPASLVSELGAWPTVARLWEASGRPLRPEPLQRVLAHRRAEELLEALEAVLDSGGDVPRAAEAIHVHRSTLYRRIEAAQELTGMLLDRGDDRLRLHLALRMRRLAAADA
jgi:PucR-like helix-turn-helix protein